MTQPLNPALTQAKWQFGLIAPEKMPEIACDALQQGFDGRILRQIAGLNSPTGRDIEKLLPSFFAEMGLARTMKKQEAGMFLAKHIAGEIGAGKIDPYAGANRIWLHISFEIEDRSELSIFAGLASEYQDHPNLRDKIRKDIVDAASKFVASYKRQ